MTKNIVEFPNIGRGGGFGNPSNPTSGPLNPLDSKYYQRGSVQNIKIVSTARAATAIVAPQKNNLSEFTDIQEAIDSVDKLGGGTVLVKTGTYYPVAKIQLASKVSLIGEGPENTIIDFSQTSLDAGSSTLYSGGIEAIGDLVTETGTGIIMTTGDATVTGTSTTFSDDGVKEGDILFFGNAAYIVDSVTSNTSLEIKKPFQGQTSPAATTYKILRPKNSITVSNLKVKHTVQSNTDLIVIKNAQDVILDNIVADEASRTGLVLEAVHNFRIQNCQGVNGVTGISIDDTAFGSGVGVTDGQITNSYAFNNSTRGLLIDGENINVVGGDYSHNDQGIKLQGEGASVIGTRIVECDTDGIVIEDSAYNKIQGCFINGNGGDGVSLTVVAGPPTNDDTLIISNTISSNGAYGVDINSTAQRTVIQNNDLASNTSGKINDLGVNTKADVWLSWTPTWTNITVGNGSVTARYIRLGDKVAFRIYLSFGSTTSISGDVTFSLPDDAHSNYSTQRFGAVGNATLHDAGTSVYTGVLYIDLSTSVAHILAQDGSATYLFRSTLSSTVPFTWTTSDTIDVHGFYEAA